MEKQTAPRIWFSRVNGSVAKTKNQKPMRQQTDGIHKLAAKVLAK